MITDKPETLMELVQTLRANVGSFQMNDHKFRQWAKEYIESELYRVARATETAQPAAPRELVTAEMAEELLDAISTEEILELPDSESLKRELEVTTQFLKRVVQQAEQQAAAAALRRAAGIVLRGDAHHLGEGAARIKCAEAIRSLIPADALEAVRPKK